MSRLSKQIRQDVDGYYHQSLLISLCDEIEALESRAALARSWKIGAVRLAAAVWCDVRDGLTNARSQAGDAALDLRDMVDRDWVPERDDATADGAAAIVDGLGG